MRIAMIGHKRVPSREGGIEIVVEELSTRLAKLNHEVTIFNRKCKGFKRIKDYKGCKIKTIFTINKKSFDAIIYAFFATFKAVFSRKYDVLHFHAEGPCFFLWMTKFSKKRIVVTIHGLDWQRSKWGGLATRIIKKGEQRAVKYADQIIVLSRANQDYFLKIYDRKTTFIPNGVDLPQIKKTDLITKKYRLVGNDYILFLARLVPEKGLHYLIDAYNLLSKNTQHNKKLVIAGGSSHSSEYTEKIRIMVKDNSNIIMTGFVDGQIREELFSNAFLYVLPSDVEGMPLSLLEARSYGNICLVSDIEENTSIIDEASFVFEKGNINDLHKKLEKICDIDRYRRLPFAKYKWDDVVKETLELYK